MNLKRTGAFTLRELVACVAIVVVMLGILLGMSGCSRSNGSRVGIVTKFSDKGIIWTTPEGTMQVGASARAEDWHFTVRRGDKVNYEAVKKAMRSGHRVEITYRQVWWRWSWQGDTHYFVQSVEDLGAKL